MISHTSEKLLNNNNYRILLNQTQFEIELTRLVVYCGTNTIEINNYTNSDLLFNSNQHTMKQTIFTIILFSFLQIPSLLGQSDDSLIFRLQGISIDGIEFYNVDGIEITKQSALTNFKQKNFYKKFKNNHFTKTDFSYSDSTIALKNYCVSNSINHCEGVVEYTTTYFIETYANQVTMITFSSYNNRKINTEHDFISLVLNHSIPKNIFNSSKVENLNFAGRTIPVGSNCRWMFTNNVQCSGSGQMDWSIHKTLDDANQNIENKYLLLKCRNDGKIISDEFVDVIFEGTRTKARKIIYDFTGVTSSLAGITGGETLTIYLVSTSVRRFNISCMMSYWNNDAINESGLPTLLDQVMKLDK